MRAWHVRVALYAASAGIIALGVTLQHRASTEMNRDLVFALSCTAFGLITAMSALFEEGPRSGHRRGRGSP